MAVQSIFSATMHYNQFWIRGRLSQQRTLLWDLSCTQHCLHQPRRLLCGPPQGVQGSSGKVQSVEHLGLGASDQLGHLGTPTSIPRMRRLRSRETKLAQAFELMSYLAK